MNFQNCCTSVINVYRLRKVCPAQITTKTNKLFLRHMTSYTLKCVNKHLIGESGHWSHLF